MNTTNADERSFPERLTLIRQQLNLSQERLARRLGVSFATVNRWENGHCIPASPARARLDAFCLKMIERDKLVLPDVPRR